MRTIAPSGRSSRHWPALALACLCLPRVAFPQDTGAIVGSVRDSATLGPLAAVLVEVAGEGRRTTASVATGAAGTFRIARIPPGLYTVRFVLPGWQPQTVSGQTVAAGETTSVHTLMPERSYRLNPLAVTASRTSERVLDAPAAVEVVARQDIEERPALTTAEHVRDGTAVDYMATGLQGSYVVARGFNNVFSGATLTLLDHRMAGAPSLRANIPYLNPATSLDLDRTEIVLGPGSALYGPNVEQGVIHAFTRSPIDFPGLGLSVSGGLRQQDAAAGGAAGSSDEGLIHGEGRLAVRTSEKLGLKLSGTYFTGTDFLFVDSAEVMQQTLAQACLDGGLDPTDDACLNFGAGLRLSDSDDLAELGIRVRNVAGGRDGSLERWTVDARLDWRPAPETSVVLSGGRATAARSVELTGLGAAQVRDWAYNYVQARFQWKDLFAQVYLDKSDNTDSFLLRSGRPLVDRSELWVGQLQHAAQLGGRHRLVYGLDLLHTVPKTEGTINGKNEGDDEITEVGGFLQAEAMLGRQFDLVLAARLDQNSRLSDPVVSPRAALVFRPEPGHSVRLTYNRAFSTPNTISFFLDLSGGTVPLFGPFRYDVRAQGGADAGFTFRREEGIPMHQSPFSPLLGGSVRDFVPTTTPALWNEAVAAVEALAVGGAVSDTVAELLASLPVPDNSQVGILALTVNPDAEGDDPPFLPAPGDLAGIEDLPPLGPGITNTLEAGYKGLLGDRLLVAANAWYSHVSNRISALRVISPNVFLEGSSLDAYLTDQFLGLVGPVFPDEQAARTAADQLAGLLSELPLGVVAPEQAGGSDAAIVLTDRNLSAIDLFGVDVSVSVRLTASWSLNATAAWVSDDAFRAGGGATAEVIPLNAPTLKGSAALRYFGLGDGLNGALRVRALKGFPASSGVYSGDVEGYEIVDLNVGYRLAGTGLWAQLEIQNLFDAGYQAFPGAPAMGRLTLLRLRYDLNGL